jgi:hypothetical protein
MGARMTAGGEDSPDRPHFGWFSVETELASAADARVFHCFHVPAQRSYVLRLPAGDEASWHGPPGNAVLEHPNARATATATGSMYPRRYFGRGRSGGGDEVVLPEYYGVLDLRYLVPVSAVYRRRGAVEFERLLAFASEFMRVLPFWENLWLLLTSEADLMARGSVPFESWSARWSDLIRGSSLGRQLLDDLPEGTGERVAAGIAALVGEDLGPGPSFEESAILRLMTAVTGSQLDEAQVEASLSCPFFRMNVTLHDLRYAVALLGLMEAQTWLVQSPLEWLGPTMLSLPPIVNGLLEQPAAFPDDAGAFESCAAPDDETLSRFSLFVQDPERTVRPYLALEREEA